MSWRKPGPSIRRQAFPDRTRGRFGAIAALACGVLLAGPALAAGDDSDTVESLVVTAR